MHHWIPYLAGREKLFLLILAGISLLLSVLLTVFISYPRGSGVDGALYALSGANLFMGNGLTYSDVPNTFLWPLFSVLIGMVNLLVQDLQIAAHSVLIGSFVLSIFPFYYSIRNLFQPEVAVIGTLLYALNGFIIRLSGRLLAEMVLVFMLIMSLYFASRMIQLLREEKILRWTDSLFCGFFLGLSYLTKPEAFQFGAIMIIFFWILILIRKTFRQHIAKIFLMTILFLVTISPQIIFVHQVTGKWVLTTYNRFLFRPVIEPFLGLRAGDTPSDPRVEYNYHAYVVRSAYTNESLQRDLQQLGPHTKKYWLSFFTIIGPFHFLMLLFSFFLLRGTWITERRLVYLLLIPLLTLFFWYTLLDRHFMIYIPFFIIISAVVLWKLGVIAQSRGGISYGLGIGLFVLVFLQSYTPVANNAPTNRVIENHRALGEWMRDHLPEARGKLIADRKPFIVFLAQGRYFRYNNPTDSQWLIEHLKTHQVDYLIVEEFMVRRYNPNIRDLLDAKDREGLQVVHVEDHPKNGRAVLYRVLR